MQAKIPVVKLSFEVHVLGDDGKVQSVRTLDGSVAEAGFGQTIEQLVEQVLDQIGGA